VLIVAIGERELDEGDPGKKWVSERRGFYLMFFM
jgi:hypothetical protein